MSDLTRHGSPVTSVFDLLGSNENDLTSALGFALTRSPRLLRTILHRVWPNTLAADLRDATIALEVRGAGGRTDLQISLPHALLIIEAKRGWLLPTVGQLAAYVPRVHAVGAGSLISLSQASNALAQAQLPSVVDGVPLTHLSWRDIMADIKTVSRESRGHERAWLDELSVYLRRVVWLRSIADSWTYCVSLSNVRPGGPEQRSYKEFVTHDHTYFHPYGTGGWPTVLPNFLAFRWSNAVHRIHRVTAAEVIPSLRDRWPAMPDTDGFTLPHVVYQLGPQLPPTTPIPSGVNYRATRTWVLLDQLQTAATLQEAMDATDTMMAELR